MDIEDKQIPIICQCQLPRDGSNDQFGLYYIDNNNYNSSYRRDRNQKNIRFPIENIDYDIKISNNFSETTIIQIYKNFSDKFIDAKYVFPVSSDSCFHSFEAEFNGKTVKGTVKEKKEAEKEFKEHKEKGNTVAMQKVSDDSPDIMKVDLANIQPDSTIKITIKCIQQLNIAMNKFYEYKILQKMTPRYCNSLSGQDIQEYLPYGSKQQQQQKFGHRSMTQNIRITVDSTDEIQFLKSPNYQYDICQYNEEKTQVSLVFEDLKNIQHDFQLLFSTKNIEKPQVLLSKNPNNQQIYGQVSFVPNFSNLQVDDAYEQLLKDFQNFQVDIQSSPAEFVFILDRSGSMSGQRIKYAKKALQLFLQSLPEKSYFNVYSFGSRYSKMFQNSVEYTQKNLNKAQDKVRDFEANYGGTEMYEPIKDALSQKKQQNLPRIVYLLTDGDIYQPEQIIGLVKKSLKNTRLHTIGIGSGCSEYLVKQVADSGKGYSVFVQDSEDMREKIINLLEKSLTPCLDNFSLEFDRSIVKSIYPNPLNMPMVLKNEPCTFYIHFNEKFQQNTQILLKYYDSTAEIYQNFGLQIDDQQGKLDENLYKLAVFKEIQGLDKNLDKKEYDDKDNKDRIEYLQYLKKSLQDQSEDSMEIQGENQQKQQQWAKQLRHCKKGHELNYFNKGFREIRSKICDLCDTKLKDKDCGVYNCDRCDFDMCFDCQHELLEMIQDQQKAMEYFQELDNIDSDIYYAYQQSIKEEIVKISVENQILSRKTAFICVVDELDDAKKQQFMEQKSQEKEQEIMQEYVQDDRFSKVFIDDRFSINTFTPAYNLMPGLQATSNMTPMYSNIQQQSLQLNNPMFGTDPFPQNSQSFNRYRSISRGRGGSMGFCRGRPRVSTPSPDGNQSPAYSPGSPACQYRMRRSRSRSLDRDRNRRRRRRRRRYSRSSSSSSSDSDSDSFSSRSRSRSRSMSQERKKKKKQKKDKKQDKKSNQKEKQQQQQSSSQNLEECLQLQLINGQWKFSQKLLDILNLSKQKWEEVKNNIQKQQSGNNWAKDQFDDILATLIVLQWLDKQAVRQKSLWQLCSRKAQKWLEKQQVNYQQQKINKEIMIF